MNTLLLKKIVMAPLGAALLAVSAVASPLPVGAAMPDLSAFPLEGPLPELKNHVLLVDFWASWCAPCKRSFPVMKELHDKFAGRGLIIVAISVDEKKSAMEDFLKKNPAPFTIVRDGAGKTPEAFHAEAMPTSFVIRADGMIAAVHSGFEGQSTRKEYLAEIEAALQAAGK